MCPAPTRFPVAGDVIALTIVDGAACVLLVERKYDPFAGTLAFPGGFVEPGEDLATAALRELREETGITKLPTVWAQLGAYGVGNRDPRGDTVSVVYVAIDTVFGVIEAGDDAAAALWVPLIDALQPGALAFDHGSILLHGLRLAQSLLMRETGALVGLSEREPRSLDVLVEHIAEALLSQNRRGAPC